MVFHGFIGLWIDKDSFNSYIDIFVGYLDLRSGLEHPHTYVEHPVRGPASVTYILQLAACVILVSVRFKARPPYRQILLFGLVFFGLGFYSP